MKKKILIIKSRIKNWRFFLNLYNEIAKYYDITLLTYDTETHKDIIDFEYINYNNNYYNSNMILKQIMIIGAVLKTIKLIKQKDFDLIYLNNHRYCFLYKFLAPSRKYVLQMYTSIVSTTKIQRNIRNTIDNKLNLLFYKHIFVSTKFEEEEFKRRNNNIYNIGWGYTIISNTLKKFDNLRLMYIGTFNNRRIYETITGFSKFYNKHRDKINMKYYIMGYGSNKEIEKINNVIQQNNLNDIVIYLGYVSDEDLRKYFDVCNVGVSYVPITRYYTNLEVTKTYEYHLSGIPTIATKTNKHIEIVNNINGVLIEDTSDGFFKGLEKIQEHWKYFDSKKIKDSRKTDTYEFLVREKMKKIFDCIIKES